jgi:hypothetical protein
VERQMRKGTRVCFSFPQDEVLSPSLAVRRLQVREELDRSSCGNVLFNGYLPPPGEHSQLMLGRGRLA